MKKFSNKIGVKVADEPVLKISKPLKTELDVKNKIYTLMNEFVHIKLDGTHDPMFLQNVHISGKEMFINAMYDYIMNVINKNNKDVIQESRNKAFDMDLSWFDSKIDFLNEEISKYNSDDYTLKNMLLNEERNLNVEVKNDETEE